MVHDRHDPYEGQDEGEYHFSDDQANYEIEPELSDKSPETEVPAAVTPTLGGAATVSGTQSYKRPLIGMAVFFVLIFLVYKILAPSASAPVTEFSQGTKIPVAPRPVMEVAKPQTQAPAPVQPAPVVAQATLPAAAPMMQTPPSAAISQPAPQPMPVAQPVVTAPAPIPAPVQPAAPPVQPVVTMPSPPQPVAQPVVQQQVIPAAPFQPGLEQATMSQSEAIGQTAKSQQDSQRIAELETQNGALQGKLQDMSLRLASMEATLTHLGKIMQDVKTGNHIAPPPGVMTSSSPPPRPIAAPKVTYSVQAIIPGRAWLKSESGDTVTVAEGDVIRDFGRVVRIDPYDGVVEIDSAGRTITLSYGINSD